jgi:uncharacterized metal-binding protein
MPCYKTHCRYNSLLFLPITLLLLNYFFCCSITYNAIFSTSYLYATFVMTPDVDIANKIKFLSLRGIVSMPFILYAKIFRHRGISHRIFIGSITRMLWLILCASIILSIFKVNHIFTNSFIKYIHEHQQLITPAIAGIIIADLFHLSLDTICKNKRK